METRGVAWVEQWRGAALGDQTGWKKYQITWLSSKGRLCPLSSTPLSPTASLFRNSFYWHLPHVPRSVYTMESEETELEELEVCRNGSRTQQRQILAVCKQTIGNVTNMVLIMWACSCEWIEECRKRYQNAITSIATTFNNTCNKSIYGNFECLLCCLSKPDNDVIRNPNMISTGRTIWYKYCPWVDVSKMIAIVLIQGPDDNVHQTHSYKSGNQNHSLRIIKSTISTDADVSWILL